MASKKKTPQPYPVHVIWRDAHSMYHNWEDLAEPPSDKEEYLVNTVGYLLHNRKKNHTVVALNLSDYHVGDGIAIPDAMVVSITRLYPRKK